MEGRATPPAARCVAFWLLGCCVLLAVMVLLGGLTRLTGSGLSITEWKPISGIVPPLNDAQWQAEFRRMLKARAETAANTPTQAAQ